MNTPLSSLYFAGTRSRRNFSRALSQSECSLEWLDHSNNDFDDDAMTCLGDGCHQYDVTILENFRKFRHHRRGVAKICNLSENPLSALKRINVNSSNIGDEGRLAFASALVNNSTLVSLHMAKNPISSTGWVVFFNTLLTSNSTCEHLTLDDDELSEENCWNALACTLCDAFSIASIFSSNHPFFNIGSFYDPITALVNDAPITPWFKQSDLQGSRANEDSKVSLLRWQQGLT